MRNNVLIMISFIQSRFENLYPLTGDFGAVEPADQFFGFSGKHGAADNFDPAGPWVLIFFSM
jgi:hypothetical protein